MSSKTTGPLQTTVVRIGQRRAFARDLYAHLIHARWRTLLLLFVVGYIGANLLFAEVYLTLGNCIEGAEEGSYLDAFSFSVQTMSTIGYGALAPRGVCGDVLVSIQSLAGLLGFAVATGILFSKFARPSAGVIFSRKAIISPRNGQPCLMFRVANERGSDIVEAAVRVTALVTETTTEGDGLRRLIDLPLMRDTTPILLMSWLVVHPIDENSPLHGLTDEDLIADNVRIIVSLTGIDGGFMQTVYAYHAYVAADLFRDHQFADVITDRGDGSFLLDLTKFHDVRAHQNDADLQRHLETPDT